MAVASVKTVKPLTTKERLFLSLYYKHDMNAQAAALELAQKLGLSVSEPTAAVQGSRYLKRIRASGDFQAILEANNLDDARLSFEVNRLLRIKKPAIDRNGDVVGHYDDGQTQVKAAAMLQDVLGHSSKAEINLVTDLPAIVVEAEPDDEPEAE